MMNIGAVVITNIDKGTKETKATKHEARRCPIYLAFRGVRGAYSQPLETPKMRRTTIAAVAAAFCLSTIAFAQDAPATNPTHYKTVAENPTIRVLKVTYGAG